MSLPNKTRTYTTAGLIGILRELHDDLDRAVFDAYGWPHNLTTEQILERVVALNAERRAEEGSGLIRWLRPDFQAPNAVATTPHPGWTLPTKPPPQPPVAGSLGPPASPTSSVSSRTLSALARSKLPSRSPPASAPPPVPASPKSSPLSRPLARPASPQVATPCSYLGGMHKVGLVDRAPSKRSRLA